MKKNTNTVEPISEHFTEAAYILVDEIKTPDVLLDFLNDVIYCRYKFEKENPDHNAEHSEDYLLSITDLIRELVIPWIRGGKDHPEENIARGISQVWSHNFYKGYIDLLTAISTAYFYDYKHGVPVPESREKDLLVLTTLFRIGENIEAYDEEFDAKRKKSKEAA